LQDWAFSALDLAPSDRFAKNLVALELRAAGEGVNALQLAYETNAKHFLTHWASEEVIDQQWRSGSRHGVTIELPSNFSWPLLLFQARFMKTRCNRHVTEMQLLMAAAALPGALPAMQPVPVVRAARPRETARVHRSLFLPGAERRERHPVGRAHEADRPNEGTRAARAFGRL
jgi:hypothetical protein